MVMRIESSLRLENDSEPRGEGWWKWSVWVDGSSEDLAGLESVTYRLHPTFPKPVVQVTDASTKFRFSSAGWGEFAISADAHMKDGRTIRLERWLELGSTKDASTIEKRRPSVFLSYSVADSETVNVLCDALAKQGIDVRTAEQSVEAGGDFLPQIDRQLQEADAVVALVSEPPSRFVEQEALTAYKKGRYVIPVVLGGAKVYGKLSELGRFELPDTRNVDGLAHQIAARVKDHAIPNETS
jgi:hypothetical protein